MLICVNHIPVPAKFQIDELILANYGVYWICDGISSHIAISLYHLHEDIMIFVK